MSDLGELFRSALGLFESGHLTEAEDACRMLALAFPQAVEPMHLAGLVALQQGRPDVAAERMGRAAIVDASNAEIQHDHAQALKAAGKLRDAVGAFRRAIRLCPDSPALYCNLANTYRQLGELEPARENYLAALDLAPGVAEIHANYASFLREAGETLAAESACRHALRIRSDHVMALVVLGQILLDQGRTVSASDPLLRALDLSPGHKGALTAYGEALFRLGQFAGALHCLKQVLALDPDAREARRTLALLNLRTGRGIEAASALDLLLRQTPDDPELLLMMGEALSLSGRHNEAMERFGAAVGAGGGDNAIFRLAVELAEDGDTVSAHNLLQNTIDERIAGGRDATLFRMARRLFFSPVPADIEAQNDEVVRDIVADAFASDDQDGLIQSRIDPLTLTRFPPVWRAALRPEGDAQLRMVGGLWQTIAASYDVAPASSVVSTAGRKVRLGIVSANMHDNGIGRWIAGLIGGLDRDRFDVTVIRPPLGEDDITARIDRDADLVVRLPLDPIHSAGVIAGLDLDVLHYTDAQSDAYTMLLASWRLAPLQIAGGGLAATTGLASIDVHVVADDWEPAGGEARFTEELVRLPGLFAQGQRPEMPDMSPGELRKQWRIDQDRNSYLCPQPLDVLTADFDPLIAEILRLDETAELLLIAPARDSWDAAWGRRFSVSHADVAGRMRFVTVRNRADMLSLLCAVDVVLESPSWNDAMLAFDCLGMGVPLVTLPGKAARTRRSHTCYRQISVFDCVAYNSADYVETALTLATDKRRRDIVSQAIRSRAHALFGDQKSMWAYMDFLESRTG
ncbi:tetratricopeptide repeat protein [Thalassospira sp.]|uniref:tetratricopeptide repeat protein n=1 Tax=Thalassospira sp. TaxID=1912094 RepID=UPI0027329CF1|nr:tetratricopeptide repeat protein [Thalassospira sp.]MDP2698173.1 tetratricopeptide repeat protein [Thalassospira sp.]